MDDPQIVSRDEWLTARKALLAQEKVFTRQRDALAADRRRLPMVEITEDYRFGGEHGEATLLDVFEGRDQLPWYSSLGSMFNYDFHVTIDADVAPVEYNYKNSAQLEAENVAWRDWSGE